MSEEIYRLTLDFTPQVADEIKYQGPLKHLDYIRQFTDAFSAEPDALINLYGGIIYDCFVKGVCGEELNEEFNVKSEDEIASAIAKKLPPEAAQFILSVYFDDPVESSLREYHDDISEIKYDLLGRLKLKRFDFKKLESGESKK